MSELHPLATVFADARVRAAAEIGADTKTRSALDATLSLMCEAGRVAWPTAKIDEATYVRYVAERSPGADAAQLERLHASDLYLACACANGDEQSIAAFDRHFVLALPKLIARKGIALDAAEEVVQSLRERLFVGVNGARAKICDYDGRGALAGWVRVAAVRAASNVRRDEGNRASLALEAESPASMAAIDRERLLIKRRYGDVFQSALHDAFASLADQERTVLRLYFTDGLNLDAIARILGISRATVGRRMITGRTHVLEETLRLLGDRLAATPTELQSLLGVVRSKLDLSLGALISLTS